MTDAGKADVLGASDPACHLFNQSRRRVHVQLTGQTQGGHGNLP